MVRLLIALVALTGAATAALADSPLPTGLYQLRQGQTVSFALPERSTRIDLGVAGVLEAYLPRPKVLQITAERSGLCLLVILFANGDLRHFSVLVLNPVPSTEVQKAATEIRRNLASVPGISVVPEGPRVVIRGTAPVSSENLYRSIIKVYGGLVVDEVKFTAEPTAQASAGHDAGGYDVFDETFRSYDHNALVTNKGRYEAGYESPHGRCSLVTAHYAICQQSNGRPALVLAKS